MSAIAPGIFAQVQADADGLPSHSPAGLVDDDTRVLGAAAKHVFGLHKPFASLGPQEARRKQRGKRSRRQVWGSSLGDGIVEVKPSIDIGNATTAQAELFDIASTVSEDDGPCNGALEVCRDISGSTSIASGADRAGREKWCDMMSSGSEGDEHDGVTNEWSDFASGVEETATNQECATARVFTRTFGTISPSPRPDFAFVWGPKPMLVGKENEVAQTVNGDVTGDNRFLAADADEDSVMGEFIEDLATIFAYASDTASLKVGVRKYLAKFVRRRMDSGGTKASATAEGLALIKEVTEFSKTGGEG